ncbi:EpsG family protein [Nitratireductor aestuarii]|uniref:EpsG family protein n=1 Tax=Nitratireductor aestuarii TaxID=1735103 RepID=UPI001664C60F|nr:EpsG family protein [Nitratireductor aestuarii]
MLYFAVFILLLILNFATAYKFRSRLAVYWLVFIFLFLFSAFRFEVGCDWTGYLFQYDLQHGAGLQAALERREPLWWITIELTQWAGLPYPWLNVFSSALFFLGVHILARRQPDPLAFLMLLFPILILNMPMSGIRQGAAIGIMCISFTAFQDGRFIRYVLWTLVAASFHSSAMIFLLLAPLIGGNLSKGRLALAGFLAIPGGLLLLSGESGELAISRYVERNIDAFGAIYRTGTLFLSAIFFSIFLRRRWKKAFGADFTLAGLGALMMFAVFPFSAVSTVIADRVGYYLMPLQAMIFARTPFLAGKLETRLLIVSPYLALSLMLLVWTTSSNLFTLCYVPYQTWLFGFPSHNLPFQ